jgi:hypothetical protein
MTKLLTDAILDVYTKQVRRRTIVLTLSITDKLLPDFSDGIQASCLTPWMSAWSYLYMQDIGGYCPSWMVIRKPRAECKGRNTRLSVGWDVM